MTHILALYTVCTVSNELQLDLVTQASSNVVRANTAAQMAPESWSLFGCWNCYPGLIYNSITSSRKIIKEGWGGVGM